MILHTPCDHTKKYKKIQTTTETEREIDLKSWVQSTPIKDTNGVSSMLPIRQTPDCQCTDTCGRNFDLRNGPIGDC